MLSRLPHRRPRELLLDAVFLLWVLQVMVTGHVVPTFVQELIRQDAPITVVSEPGEAPKLEEIAPPLPET